MTLFPSKQHRIEQALLKRAVAGDSKASKEVIHLLSSPAYSLAWKMLGNKEDAEDVVQEAFIRLWNFYLMYCAAGFSEQNIDVVQFTLSHRPTKKYMQ